MHKLPSSNVIDFNMSQKQQMSQCSLCKSHLCSLAVVAGLREWRIFVAHPRGADLVLHSNTGFGQ